MRWAISTRMVSTICRSTSITRIRRWSIRTAMGSPTSRRSSPMTPTRRGRRPMAMDRATRWKSSTHHSDPREHRLDNDGYSDSDEVLYGGNPNDPFGLPQPTYQLQPDIEGTPNLAGMHYALEQQPELGTDASVPHAAPPASNLAVLPWADQQREVERVLHRRPADFWARVDSGTAAIPCMSIHRWSAVALFVWRPAVVQRHASDHSRYSLNRTARRRTTRACVRRGTHRRRGFQLQMIEAGSEEVDRRWGNRRGGFGGSLRFRERS